MLLQVAELGREHRLVPAGVQRELVVGDDVGALLRLGPARCHHHRRVRKPELPGRFAPARGRQ